MRDRNLLIEGGPGAGKSTFTQHISRILASAWLNGRSAAEEVPDLSAIAVRVPARHLAGNARWRPCSTPLYSRVWAFV